MRQNRLVSIISIVGIVGTCLVIFTAQNAEPAPSAQFQKSPGESAGDGREPVGDPQIPNGAFNERIPAIEALSGFLVNSGDEDEGDYDNGARIYETDQDTYDTYKDKVKEYYLKNSVE